MRCWVVLLETRSFCESVSSGSENRLRIRNWTMSQAFLLCGYSQPDHPFFISFDYADWATPSLADRLSCTYWSPVSLTISIALCESRPLAAISLRWLIQAFPSGSVVKNPACQCRRHGFDSWSRKIPRATEQLIHGSQLPSLCSRARELQLLSPHTTTTEALAPQSLCSTRETTAEPDAATAVAPAHHNSRKPA